MNQHDTPAKVASTDGLGPLLAEAPTLVERLRTRPTGDPHLHMMAHEAADEIERLRATLAAIAKHSTSTLRTNSKHRGDWAEDVAFMGKLARGH